MKKPRHFSFRLRAIPIIVSAAARRVTYFLSFRSSRGSIFPARSACSQSAPESRSSLKAARRRPNESGFSLQWKRPSFSSKKSSEETAKRFSILKNAASLFYWSENGGSDLHPLAGEI